MFRDGVLVADKQQFEGNFTFNFTYLEHQLTITQHGEHFELRIDNVSFSHIHARAATQNEFAFDKGGNGGAQDSRQYPFQTR